MVSTRILATLKGDVGDLDNAARAIGIAILFDAFDGFIARATHTSTDFGKQFDSLADMVSFGIAPAILGFAWGVRNMLGSEVLQGRQVYQLGWLVSLAFVICGAWRLARFNVQGMAPGGLRYFVGLPYPLRQACWLLRCMPASCLFRIGGGPVAWLCLMLALAALMASTIRYPSFKGLPWGKRQPSVSIVLLALLVWLIIVYSEAVLLLMASTYIASGLAIHAARVIRHRLISRAV